MPFAILYVHFANIKDANLQPRTVAWSKSKEKKEKKKKQKDFRAKKRRRTNDDDDDDDEDFASDIRLMKKLKTGKVLFAAVCFRYCSDACCDVGQHWRLGAT